MNLTCFKQINTLENYVRVVLNSLRNQNSTDWNYFLNRLLNDEAVIDAPKEIKFIEHVLKKPELFVSNISAEVKEQIPSTIKRMLLIFLESVEPLAQEADITAFQFKL